MMSYPVISLVNSSVPTSEPSAPSVPFVALPFTLAHSSATYSCPGRSRYSGTSRCSASRSAPAYAVPLTTCSLEKSVRFARFSPLGQYFIVSESVRPEHLHVHLRLGVARELHRVRAALDLLERDERVRLGRRRARRAAPTTKGADDGDARGARARPPRARTRRARGRPPPRAVAVFGARSARRYRRRRPSCSPRRRHKRPPSSTHSHALRFAAHPA